ncbi:MAG TPA: hypothetical protein VJK03_05415 [Candidatus Nanoarchaeia archaeon]|nr:hypothetical protein [Candidatus Nanoarchaeia archaeon]
MELLHDRNTHYTDLLKEIYGGQPFTAFSFDGAEKILSRAINAVKKDSNLYYSISIGNPSYNVNLRSKFYRPFSALTFHDCGEEYSLDSSFVAKVQRDWSSDGFGDWEMNTGPRNTGEVRVQSTIRDRIYGINISEKLDFRLWAPHGDIPACRIVLDVKHEKWFGDYIGEPPVIEVVRRDYAPVMHGRALRMPVLRELLWERSPQMEKLPLDAFLASWVSDDLHPHGYIQRL